MTSNQPGRLDRPVNPDRDHVLGGDAAEITLIEYGSYACRHCHAAHRVISNLRERFGDRLRYVYRHLPLTDRVLATRAAEMAEYADETAGRFWEIHDALMSGSPDFGSDDLERVADEFGLPPRGDREPDIARRVGARVREDAQSGLHSGARATPTFFINGRRYDGAWDESSLTDALLGSVGHRLRTATIEFASWAPSTGLLLLVMAVLAITIANTAFGPAFDAWWHTPFGLRFGDTSLTLPLLEWVNDGLLTIFFLVVGLEIKRELTVGRLASPRAAALPIAGAVGGMTMPALIYVALIAPESFAHGWGMTIATDTAFAVALIVLLGNRVPVDLRIFLTAAVIVDDLVAIIVVALFYSDAIIVQYLLAAIAVTALLAGLNRSGVYRALPYAVLGVLLWVFLHEAGLHATLAGVILAIVTPTRPPANITALMAQAEAVIAAERTQEVETEGDGLSRPTLEALDVIHDRIESPASKLLRATEPWSSYLVLPVFALANAGVALSAGVLDDRGALVMAIVLGLVVGKPVGILAGSWLAVRAGIARKPDVYSWRQLLGAGALAGIGFTMSLFIAGQAFPVERDFMAAKIAIFIASITAGTLGVAILWRRRDGRTEWSTPIA